MKVATTPNRFASSVSLGLVGSLSDLRRNVEQRLTPRFRPRLPLPLIRRALDEAAETAQTTDFPHLFFPTLAEERLQMIDAALASDRHPALRRAA